MNLPKQTQVYHIDLQTTQNQDEWLLALLWNLKSQEGSLDHYIAPQSSANTKTPATGSISTHRWPWYMLITQESRKGLYLRGVRLCHMLQWCQRWNYWHLNSMKGYTSYTVSHSKLHQSSRKTLLLSKIKMSNGRRKTNLLGQRWFNGGVRCPTRSSAFRQQCYQELLVTFRFWLSALAPYCRAI